MNLRTKSSLVGLLWGTVLLAASPLSAASETIPTRLFDPEFLEGDCNYHNLTSASDGQLYFSLGTHNDRTPTHLYRFDPQTEQITLIANLSDVLGESVDDHIPHGKIHTPLIEHDGHLYFGTHTAYYTGNLPNMTPPADRAPYSGGHFMRYDLQSGEFEDLAQLQLPNEGIITAALDRQNEILYGLTWPTGLLLSYDLNEGMLKNWGAVQQRGEWGRLPAEWNFICRRLGLDDDGNLFGGTDTGKIWRFEADQQRPVHYYENLNLTHLAPVQEADFSVPAEAHFFWNNWRTILWNDLTDSFWGLQGGSTQLFEFKPATGMLRSVRSLRPAGVDPLTRRNPFRTQLGFMLGPKNTLLYLAHAPDQPVPGRPDVRSSVRLVSYQIDEDRYTDHGRLTTADGRRIFFTESIEIGADDHLYTVAWVETTDPDREDEIRAARKLGAPDEQKEALFEMMLVQLPKWDQFIR
ncbi:MAG: hypothetical protein SynsKO_16150 [Synoicihabitans sp.]